MKLQKARIQNYRSIRDSGWFDIEPTKTILVGPNEAGKSVLLRALERINSSNKNSKFDPLRDYPRSELINLSLDKDDGKPISISDVPVVEAQFLLEEDDTETITKIDKRFADATTYMLGPQLDNQYWHKMDGGPQIPTFGQIRSEISNIFHYIDIQLMESEHADLNSHFVDDLFQITSGWDDSTPMSCGQAQSLAQLLSIASKSLENSDILEIVQFQELVEKPNVYTKRNEVMNALYSRLPIFVYFSDYFRVHARIHLDQLANRIDQGILDQNPQDFGNACLLKLLGFDARQLSEMGNVARPSPDDEQAIRIYENQLDHRRYQLDSASTQLTERINDAWKPNPDKSEFNRLHITADQQYLRVVVEDGLNTNVGLDQKSEGYQWLVSFFVVFFAEARDSYKNAVLLLDEPGLSLHGLKQKEFCSTISRLAETNQLLYTTHSPFMVGSDELDLVRVVEMTDRATGTVVHSTIAAGDSAALLPLQEALGYDLAQNLFVQKRNLILEGLTDYWYLDAVASLLREAKYSYLDGNIALIPASGAGRVVYFATILHSNNLKVAALLDSDSAGDAAASVDTLVHTLRNKNILRTKDAYTGPVTRPEIEDMLRDTLISIAKSDLKWDVSTVANDHRKQPILNIFANEIGNDTFSKYKLAKAFLRWTRDHEATDLTEIERNQWKTLINKINKALG
ncbi:MAG: AAA family ATPase [Caldilineaceae bacterium]|nr:AAA family ATPase [Caldilineaceae bacterium]